MLRIAQGIAGLYLLVAVLVTGVTMVQGPLLGGAPLGGVLDRLIKREPIVVLFAYSTEKREWLEAAAARFAETNPRVRGRPIQIELEGVGSREIVTRIIQRDLQPTAISPASSVQIELLREKWDASNPTPIYLEGADAPEPLVITPLVVVAWEERATTLGLDQPDQLWDQIHALLAADQGWAAFGRPEWGLGKFGQTSPVFSNSGTQTLILLAYNYHNKTTGLSSDDILDPGFRAWLDVNQRAVPDFPTSTGLLMDDVVRFGPSKYDFVVVYENLAAASIETAENRWGAIRVYYPAANILSDHPYAILNAPWVTQEQREAAAVFRDFLLSKEMQELALVQYGFRPANVQVGLDLPNNPFDRYASFGLQRDIAQVVELPSGRVLSELIDLWEKEGYDTD